MHIYRPRVWLALTRQWISIGENFDASKACELSCKWQPLRTVVFSPASSSLLGWFMFTVYSSQIIGRGAICYSTGLRQSCAISPFATSCCEFHETISQRGKKNDETRVHRYAWAMARAIELMMLLLLIIAFRRKSEADAPWPEVWSLRIKQRKP